jgi:hypothetical protein
MSTVPLKDRVAALEYEIAQLKAKLETPTELNEPWWKQIQGTFAGDPAYLEAMRLGKAYRDSFKPKVKKRKHGQ